MRRQYNYVRLRESRNVVTSLFLLIKPLTTKRSRFEHEHYPPLTELHFVVYFINKIGKCTLANASTWLSLSSFIDVCIHICLVTYVALHNLDRANKGSCRKLREIEWREVRQLTVDRMKGRRDGRVRP